MGHSGAKSHQNAGMEYRRKQKDILQMLTALKGVVVDIKITFHQGIGGKQLGTGAEGGANGPQLHGDQFRLGHHVAVAVQQGRGTVIGLSDHRRIGRADQLRG